MLMCSYFRISRNLPNCLSWLAFLNLCGNSGGGTSGTSLGNVGSDVNAEVTGEVPREIALSLSLARTSFSGTLSVVLLTSCSLSCLAGVMISFSLFSWIALQCSFPLGFGVSVLLTKDPLGFELNALASYPT